MNKNNPYNFEIGDCCPKCKRPECLGDCGLFTREEKEAFLKERFFSDNGKVKAERVILAKNPLLKVKFGSYSGKSNDKAK